jgi:DNA-binding MarR family transcriptional regulator
VAHKREGKKADGALEQLGADPEPLGTERYERLVDAIDGRFAQVDNMVGARVVAWIEDAGLNLHEARVLLALTEAGHPMTPSGVAKLAGLDLDTTYQTLHSLHGRGLTDEDCRRHELGERGREMMSSFARARRDGVRAYLGRLGRRELQRIEGALGSPQAATK